jgi:hypothetical protein
MRWFSFFFPQVAGELRKILTILNPITKTMPKIEFDTLEAVSVIRAAAEALVKLKSDVAAVTAQLEPLSLENESLVKLVDELKAADSLVDIELGKLAETLNPSPVVEPEPEPEPVEPEPVVEPVEPTE